MAQEQDINRQEGKPTPGVVNKKNKDKRRAQNQASNKSNRKPGDKKPKINYYWIYAVIILIFIGIQFFGPGNFNEPAKTNPQEFESFLRAGDVEKVEVVK